MFRLPNPPKVPVIFVTGQQPRGGGGLLPLVSTPSRLPAFVCGALAAFSSPFAVPSADTAAVGCAQVCRDEARAFPTSSPAVIVRGPVSRVSSSHLERRCSRSTPRFS